MFSNFQGRPVGRSKHWEGDAIHRLFVICLPILGSQEMEPSDQFLLADGCGQ